MLIIILQVVKTSPQVAENYNMCPVRQQALEYAWVSLSKIDSDCLQIEIWFPVGIINQPYFRETLINLQRETENKAFSRLFHASIAKFNTFRSANNSRMVIVFISYNPNGWPSVFQKKVNNLAWELVSALVRILN